MWSVREHKTKENGLFAADLIKQKPYVNISLTDFAYYLTYQMKMKTRQESEVFFHGKNGIFSNRSSGIFRKPCM